MRGMGAGLLALFLCLPALDAARAEARPPRFDVDSHCSLVANTPDGFSVELEQQCFQRQSDAEDSIKRVWDETPEYIQDDCTVRSRASGDADYEILRQCIHDEMRQALPGVAMPGQ
jgi:hypothetical protein